MVRDRGRAIRIAAGARRGNDISFRERHKVHAAHHHCRGGAERQYCHQSKEDSTRQPHDSLHRHRRRRRRLLDSFCVLLSGLQGCLLDESCPPPTLRLAYIGGGGCPFMGNH